MRRGLKDIAAWRHANSDRVQKYRKLAAPRLQSKREKDRERKAGRPKPDVCEICSEFNRFIAFDHCHKTGKFRGWLCDRCNRVLGLLKDDAQLFYRMGAYLERGGTHGKVNVATPKAPAKIIVRPQGPAQVSDRYPSTRGERPVAGQPARNAIPKTPGTRRCLPPLS
jgi:hypothetical protein